MIDPQYPPHPEDALRFLYQEYDAFLEEEKSQGVKSSLEERAERFATHLSFDFSQTDKQLISFIQTTDKRMEEAKVHSCVELEAWRENIHQKHRILLACKAYGAFRRNQKFHGPAEAEVTAFRNYLRNSGDLELITITESEAEKGMKQWKASQQLLSEACGKGALRGALAGLVMGGATLLSKSCTVENAKPDQVPPPQKENAGAEELEWRQRLTRKDNNFYFPRIHR